MARRLHLKKRSRRRTRRGGDSTSSSSRRRKSMSESRPASKKKSKSSSSSKSKRKSKSSSDPAETCSICFEALSLRPNVTTKCRHTFHEDCLNGWCQAKGSNASCPTCRANIQETCQEIGPFNSLDIFKYICLNKYKPNSKEMSRRLLANPKFNPNLIDDDESLFSYLSRCLEWELLEQLLARPDLVLTAADVSEHAGNDKVRSLLIKSKKVPKSLKKLMM